MSPHKGMEVNDLKSVRQHVIGLQSQGKQMGGQVLIANIKL